MNSFAAYFRKSAQSGEESTFKLADFKDALHGVVVVGEGVGDVVGVPVTVFVTVVVTVVPGAVTVVVAAGAVTVVTPLGTAKYVAAPTITPVATTAMA
jgi:Mg2+/Co2+ transporter CorB